MHDHDRIEEQLSALIDGELSESDSQQAVDYLLSNDEAIAKWRRYHLIRDSLQGYRASSDRAYDSTVEPIESIESIDLSADYRPDASEEIAAPQSDVVPIAAAKSAIAKDDKSSHGLKTWGIGLAMAATVAAVVVFGLRFNNVVDTELNPIADTLDTSGETIAAVDTGSWDSKLQSQGSRWIQSGTPAVSAKQERLNALLVRHGEHISLSGMNGLSGYARFVSFDERRL